MIATACRKKRMLSSTVDDDMVPPHTSKQPITDFMGAMAAMALLIAAFHPLSNAHLIVPHNIAGISLFHASSIFNIGALLFLSDEILPLFLRMSIKTLQARLFRQAQSSRTPASIRYPLTFLPRLTLLWCTCALPNNLQYCSLRASYNVNPVGGPLCSRRATAQAAFTVATDMADNACYALEFFLPQHPAATRTTHIHTYRIFE